MAFIKRFLSKRKNKLRTEEPSVPVVLEFLRFYLQHGYLDRQDIVDLLKNFPVDTSSLPPPPGAKKNYICIVRENRERDLLLLNKALRSMEISYEEYVSLADPSSLNFIDSWRGTEAGTIYMDPETNEPRESY